MSHLLLAFACLRVTPFAQPRRDTVALRPCYRAFAFLPHH